MQMCLVRQVFKGLSDGRRCGPRAQSCRMHPVRKVHRDLSVDAISYRYGLDVSAEKLPLTADKK